MKIHIEEGPMKSHEFIIEGNPVPKGRPRFSRKSGHVYTPKITRDEEARIKNILKREIGKIALKKRPVILTLSFFLKRPKRLLKANPGPIPHIVRPDLDNLVKLISDASNDILYLDDCEIFKMELEKYYHGLDDRPHTKITIKYLEECFLCLEKK